MCMSQGAVWRVEIWVRDNDVCTGEKRDEIMLRLDDDLCLEMP